MKDPNSTLHGTETVLLVEDDDAIRALASRVLERYGYTVLAACLPSEALQMEPESIASVSLIITDLVMPEMGGKVLVDKLMSISPGAKVLYMSGYSIEEAEAPDSSFLSKPFTPLGLVHQVRRVLDEA